MKVYISGPITGVKDYRKKFQQAEEYLKSLGHDVFNPCCLPDIFEYYQFMDLDLTALNFCDAIYLLNGWENSRGAKMELKEAQRIGLKIIREEEALD